MIQSNPPVNPVQPQQQQQSIPPMSTVATMNSAVAPVVSATPGMVTYNAAPPSAPGSSTSNASLYVGDLHPEITEAQIFDKFSPVGTVISIRVCRDMVSRRSLGYAYVNFSIRSEAEKAIETLNFEELKTRQMRIMWSQRDPSLRKSGVGNVFIKNLDRNIQMRDLYDTFSAFGDILSCKIANDDSGISKGYGFVHFKNQDSADKAIESLHGMMIYEKKIYVCKFRPRAERSSTEEGQPKFNNIFVKNFGDDMTDEKFNELFGAFGNVTSIKLEKNDDGSSKGFGFICYGDFDSAKRAVDEMHDKDIGNGKKIYVGRAMKKNERNELLRRSQEKKKNERQNKFAPGVNLYVKNLDDSVTDDILKKEFSIFGNITSAKVMMDSQSNRSKGFGFVCFQFAEEATRAVTEMSGKYVGTKPLYVALAQRKEERRQQLANQYIQRQMNRNNYQASAGFTGMPNPLYNPMNANYPNTANFGLPMNRGPLMTAFPQMQTGQRARFSMGAAGPMPQGMRAPNMGATGAGGMQGGPQMFNTASGVQQRPGTAQIMRPMGMSVAGQNMMAMNQQMRPQGMPMQRSPNLMGPNTRLNRPQPGNYRTLAPNMASMGSMQVGGQMPAMRFPQQGAPMQQLQQDDIMSLKNIDSIPNEESKTQMLGEHLFKHVCQIAPTELSAKITGMLLEGDYSDVKTMIEQHEAGPANSRLSHKVEKAIQVLDSRNQMGVAEKAAGAGGQPQQVAPNGNN